MSVPMLSMICLILLSISCDKNNHRHQRSFKAYERENSLPSDTMPVKEKYHYSPISREDLVQGQRIYEVNCVACHGLKGNGEGVVTYKGLTRPVSFMDQNLLNEPKEYFFDILSNGHEGKPSMQRKLTPDERWKVSHFIKALQLSQRIEVKKLTEKDRRMLP